MKRATLASLILLGTTLVLSGWAQVVIVPHLAPGPRVVRIARPRRVPCWRKAGVTRATMEQVRTIRRSARSQLNALCSDAALSAQERWERAREIRHSSRGEIEALITPAQQAQIRSCQAARGSTSRRADGGGGPCGKLPRPAAVGGADPSSRSADADDARNFIQEDEEIPDFENPE